MNLLTCILIAIPIGIIFIMLWIYNDYRKYKKKNKLAILLFLLFPTTLSAQKMGLLISLFQTTPNGKL